MGRGTRWVTAALCCAGMGGALAPGAAAAPLVELKATVQSTGIDLAVRLAGQTVLDATTGEGCDPLDPSACLYPFPSDHFTRPDPSMATGRRLALSPRAMPRNVAGKPVDPTDQNRNDGFSPGSMLITKVPGLDSQAAFDATGLVPLTDLARYADPDQPAVVINTRTGERHPIWAEIDSNPADPAARTLIIRPARNFDEGARYVVGLRNLRRADGSPIPAGPAFRAYRDGIPTGDPAMERRRPQMERIFGTLAGAGVARPSLYLAWDFTVASERNLSERALQIRDDAFARLGDRDLADLTVQGESPTFAVNPDLPDGSLDPVLDAVPDADLPFDPLDVLDVANLDGVRDFAPCSAGASPGCERGESDTVARRVAGQIAVPCYLNLPGCPPGSRFLYATPGATTPTPIPGNTTLANFLCTIPRRALDGAGQVVKPALYGHGLLGSAGEVGAGNVGRMAQEHGYVFCATDWTGMSTYDLPNVATLLVDLSQFSSLTDRAQQGFVNFMYLGRALLHRDGLGSHPAFQAGGRPIIDPTRLFYDGNSQGGIMGGSLTALAPDFDRAVLGVPGMNYSTLLRRSIDFDTYAEVMYRSYPDELTRPLLLSLIQLLWDRGEANGYAHHMTHDPLPNTPPHEVLLHVAYGDHQVANVAADVEARTIGAHARTPLLHDSRPQYLGDLIPAIPGYPFGGSATVYWDIGPVRVVNGQTRGVGDPPVGNVPPREGRDPHGAPRNSVAGRAQKAAFLQVDGRVVDVCGDAPCYADGWTGP